MGTADISVSGSGACEIRTLRDGQQLLHGGPVGIALICTEPCPRSQVGEYDIVIEVGARLLETWESRQFRRDVLLSMALAHCGLAGEHFQRQAVASGCVPSPCVTAPSQSGDQAC